MTEEATVPFNFKPGTDLLPNYREAKRVREFIRGLGFHAVIERSGKRGRRGAYTFELRVRIDGPNGVAYVHADDNLTGNFKPYWVNR